MSGIGGGGFGPGLRAGFNAKRETPKTGRVSLGSGGLGRDAPLEAHDILRRVGTQASSAANAHFKTGQAGTKINLRDFGNFRSQEEQRLLKALPLEQRRLLQDSQFGKHGTTKKKSFGMTVGKRATFKPFFSDPLPAAKQQPFKQALYSPRHLG